MEKLFIVFFVVFKYEKIKNFMPFPKERFFVK